MPIWDVTSAGTASGIGQIWDVTTVGTMNQISRAWDTTPTGAAYLIYPSDISVTDLCNFAVMGTENQRNQRYGAEYAQTSASLVVGQHYYLHAYGDIPSGCCGDMSFRAPGLSVDWYLYNQDGVGRILDNSVIAVAVTGTTAIGFYGYYYNYYFNFYRCDVVNVQEMYSLGYSDAQILAICNAQCKGRSGTYLLTI